jgi:hypothetical protein
LPPYHIRDIRSNLKDEKGRLQHLSIKTRQWLLPSPAWRRGARSRPSAVLRRAAFLGRLRDPNAMVENVGKRTKRHFRGFMGDFRLLSGDSVVRPNRRRDQRESAKCRREPASWGRFLPKK